MKNSIHRIALPLLLAAALNATEAVAPGLNQFGASAYRELARSSGNLVFSPFNIGTALSMLVPGARGVTAEQMKAVLHAIESDPEYASALAALAEQLRVSGNNGPNQLLQANGLWIQRGFPVLLDFRQILAQSYGASPRELDFSGNPEGARNEINSWTEQHTKGRIRDLFGQGSLGARDKMVLTSAIYFYGKWQSAFAAKDTKPAPFHPVSGPEVQTSFMNRTGNYGYTETPELQILEMKYAGTPMGFDILLPKPGHALPEIEAGFDASELSNWLGTLKTENVEVSMLRFRAESDFSLKQTLQNMGMSAAFSGTADFSGIDDRRDLMLSDVKHKAFVDVTEEGTEAAAATGARMTLIAMRTPPHQVFRADHPFVFLIRDTKTGVILFAGRMAKPRG